MSYKLLDTVVLVRDTAGVPAGTPGAIVEVHEGAYEVEFVARLKGWWCPVSGRSHDLDASPCEACLPIYVLGTEQSTILTLTDRDIESHRKELR